MHERVIAAREILIKNDDAYSKGLVRGIDMAIALKDKEIIYHVWRRYCNDCEYDTEDFTTGIANGLDLTLGLMGE